MSPGKSNLTNRQILGLYLFIIIIVNIYAFRHMSRLWFTAHDTFLLIESSRIQSLSDFVHLFTKNLMEETPLSKPYYRPISQLSFSIDYYFWKLNPFGFLLSNFLMHMAGVLVLFGLTTTLSNIHVAFWTAFLFSIHPALIDTVPAIPRRQDVLLMVFGLGTVWTLQIFLIDRKKKWFLLSLVLFALGLGTKETALMFLPLLVTLVCWDLYSRGRSEPIKQILSLTLPFVLLTTGFLIVRKFVLSHSGGTSFPATMGRTMTLGYSMFRRALEVIIYPYATESREVVWLLITVLILVFGLVGLLRSRIYLIKNQKKRTLYFTLGFLVTFTTSGLLLYHSLEIKPLNQLSIFFQFVSFLSTIGLLIVFLNDPNARDTLKNNSTKHGAIGSPGLFFMFYLLTGLFFLGLVSPYIQFSVRYVYPILPGYTGLLSICIYRILQDTLRLLDNTQTISSHPLNEVAEMAFIILAVVMGWRFTPLLNEFRGWEIVSNESKVIVNAIDDAVDRSDPRNVVLKNLCGFNPLLSEPHARSLISTSSRGVNSWFELKYPKNHPEIIDVRTKDPEICPLRMKDFHVLKNIKDQKTYLNFKWP